MCYFDVVLSTDYLACIGAYCGAVIVQNCQLVDVVYFNRVPLPAPNPRSPEGRLQPSEVRPNELFVLFRPEESAYLSRIARVPRDPTALDLLYGLLTLQRRLQTRADIPGAYVIDVGIREIELDRGQHRSSRRCGCMVCA